MKILARFMRSLRAADRRLERRCQELETSLRDVSTDVARARDEVIFWRDRSLDLEHRLEDARREVVDFYKAQLQPPRSAVLDPAAAARVQSRLLIQRKNREFAHQLVQLSEREHDAPTTRAGQS